MPLFKKREFGDEKKVSVVLQLDTKEGSKDNLQQLVETASMLYHKLGEKEASLGLGGKVTLKNGDEANLRVVTKSFTKEGSFGEQAKGNTVTEFVLSKQEKDEKGNLKLDEQGKPKIEYLNIPAKWDDKKNEYNFDGPNGKFAEVVNSIREALKNETNTVDGKTYVNSPLIFVNKLDEGKEGGLASALKAANIGDAISAYVKKTGELDEKGKDKLAVVIDNISKDKEVEAKGVKQADPQVNEAAVKQNDQVAF